MLSEILNLGSREKNTPQQNLKNTTGVSPIPTLQGLSFLFKHHICHFHKYNCSSRTLLYLTSLNIFLEIYPYHCTQQRFIHSHCCLLFYFVNSLLILKPTCYVFQISVGTKLNAKTSDSNNKVYLRRYEEMWGKMIILEIPSGSSLIQNHNHLFLLTWVGDHYNRDFHCLLNTYHLTHQTEN